MKYNYLCEPLIFESVLGIIESTEDHYIQYELLENFIFNIWCCDECYSSNYCGLCKKFKFK